MEKKKFSFPSAYAILLIVIVLVTLLTHVIPGGSFGTHVDPATGAEVTGLEDFEYTESTPVSFLSIPLEIVKAFSSGSTAAIVIMYMFMGGCVYIITDCGAFQALSGLLMRTLNGKRFVMVFGFTGMFALVNLVLSPHSFVAFVPFSIMFATVLGYDAIVGVAMPLLGGAVSFSTGALLATTMTAQTLVGLPIYSGALYRLACMVILLIPTTLYIYHYGESIRLGKRKSIAPTPEEFASAKQEFDQKVVPRHVMALVMFFGTIGFGVYGSNKLGWSNLELSACFMTCGILVGLLFGNRFDKVAQMYIRGSSTMLPAAVLCGMAGAVTSILTKGGIMNTVVYAATSLIVKVPTFLYAPMMFLMHLLINCVIVSGGGQAAATMPIMAPIARMVGIPMQSAVLCFNLGDGLGNYVLPHSNQLITYIGAGRIGYGQWMKFMGKLFLIWVAIACVLVYISTLIWA